MKIPAPQLIDDLINRTHKILNEAEELKQLPLESLQWRPGPEKWSVLECLEHLNRYGNFYLPEIENRLKTASKQDSDYTFKSGWLGNYFANSMLPKEKLNTMNTFKSMNPIHSKLDKEVVNEFIIQQKQMLKVLDRCRSVNLNKVKTPISISTLIKLKLGDTLRVVIYHNQRHMVQAFKVLFAMKEIPAA